MGCARGLSGGGGVRVARGPSSYVAMPIRWHASQVVVRVARAKFMPAHATVGAAVDELAAHMRTRLKEVSRGRQAAGEGGGAAAAWCRCDLDFLFFSPGKPPPSRCAKKDAAAAGESWRAEDQRDVWRRTEFYVEETDLVYRRWADRLEVNEWWG